MTDTERPNVPSVEEAGRRYARGRHDSFDSRLYHLELAVDHIDATLRGIFSAQLEPMAARLDSIEAALLELRALARPRARTPAAERPGALIDLDTRARPRKTRPAPDAPAPEPQLVDSAPVETPAPAHVEE